MPAPIYFDHNATTPVFPEVVEAVRACWNQPYLNPASQHAMGRAARRTLEDSRDRIAELLGANTTGSKPDRVIIISGGTEANNLAIRGLLRRAEASPPMAARLVISAIEHPSITGLAEHLSDTGYRVDRLGVDRDGVMRINELPSLLHSNTQVVAAMLANNETGVIQPVAELASICNKHGVPLHTDASQAAGKLPLNFHALGAATMTIAAHKFGGPLGIGALVARGDVELQPQLFGGFQQAGMRPGTESVALTVGLRTALELWHAHRQEWVSRLSSCRDRFEAMLREARLNSCTVDVIGAATERLPNTSNIAFIGLDRQQLFLALDQAGIACSTGSACASGSSEPSPTHVAMLCDPGVISSALRFSFGVGTTLVEVEDGASRILNICNGLRR